MNKLISTRKEENEPSNGQKDYSEYRELETTIILIIHFYHRLIQKCDARKELWNSSDRKFTYIYKNSDWDVDLK